MTLQHQPYGFGSAEYENAEALIALALSEDLGQRGDLTAEATIPSEATGAARFVARQSGILAGLPVVSLIAQRFGLAQGFVPERSDGDPLEPGTLIARVSGSMRAILSMERTALNFLQRLSGVATQTHRFVLAVEGTRAAILDTRKTTPGWRRLEKYAVRCGGGTNHRIGLFDAILIKDNHLAWLASSGDPIGRAITASRQLAPQGTLVEVEVDTLDQFDRALSCRPDIVLLDNFTHHDLTEAVRRRDASSSTVLLEASGGIDLASVAEVARTGVDRISVGAITHSAPSLDIGLDEEIV